MQPSNSTQKFNEGAKPPHLPPHAKLGLHITEIKISVKQKGEAGEKRLKEAVSTLHRRKYETRLERIAHIVPIAKVGRTPIISGEKERQYLEVVTIESRSGTSFTLRKARDLMEVFINDEEDIKEKDSDFEDKELIFNIDGSSLRIPTSTRGVVVHPADEQAAFKKTADRMPNTTLVAGIAADGFSLPSVVLWPSANLPKELTTLLTHSLDIWPNTNGWMDKTSWKKIRFYSPTAGCH
ncbi:uncharacterized protein MONOS_4169 [Monocercomonoides exilis]|uniref:uncharacterized protein n=1 Tax=Monocercomonoides exilis TaxID=2049356 RepID=UPI003559CA59|nr:hypothetical protein MONOS_4169 [Monocercomonoides exilis]